VIAGDEPEEAEREQWSDDGSGVIHRAMEAEDPAARRLVGEASQQRVARRAPDALADAIDKARRDDPAQPGRERKDRLGEGRQSITDGGQQLSLAEPVGERAGENLHDHRGRFGDALDQPDRGHRGAEHGDEIKRQQRVDHLRRDVHEQADQAERPDAARNILETGGRSRGRHQRPGIQAL